MKKLLVDTKKVLINSFLFYTIKYVQGYNYAHQYKITYSDKQKDLIYS